MDLFIYNSFICIKSVFNNVIGNSSSSYCLTMSVLLKSFQETHDALLRFRYTWYRNIFYLYFQVREPSTLM